MKLVRKILVAMLLGTMAIQVVWADINEDFLKEVRFCKLDKVKQLLRLGADVNANNSIALVKATNDLYFYSEKNRPCPEVIKYLISQGLDINAEYSDEAIGYDVVVTVGYRALLEAAKYDIDLAKYLISKGVDVNTDNHKYGYNIVLSNIGGTREQKLDFIKYVITKGAVLNAVDFQNLYLEYMRKSSVKGREMIELAIKSVKNLNECSGGNHILMSILTDLGKVDKEAGELLLKNGFDVNSKCQWGITMLMNTCDVDLVKYLISKGADVNIRDDKGETALTKALNNKCYNVAELLVSKGAKK